MVIVQDAVEGVTLLYGGQNKNQLGTGSVMGGAPRQMGFVYLSPPG